MSPGKKKTSSPPPSKPREFRTAPFSALQKVRLPETSAPPAAAPPEKQPSGDSEDTDLFLAAMSDVKPIASRQTSVGHAVSKQAADQKPSTETGEKEKTHGTDLFRQEIRRLHLDVTFTDNISFSDDIRPLPPNRLRQLKRGLIRMNRQIDLHGLTREEVLDSLISFLKSARSHGEKAVLVITGKGLNSPGEPVLQGAVASWLRDSGREYVAEYSPAPREYGGSGAFVVFLR